MSPIKNKMKPGETVKILLEKSLHKLFPKASRRVPEFSFTSRKLREIILASRRKRY